MCVGLIMCRILLIVHWLKYQSIEFDIPDPAVSPWGDNEMTPKSKRKGIILYLDNASPMEGESDSLYFR